MPSNSIFCFPSALTVLSDLSQSVLILGSCLGFFWLLVMDCDRSGHFSLYLVQRSLTIDIRCHSISVDFLWFAEEDYMCIDQHIALKKKAFSAESFALTRELPAWTSMGLCPWWGHMANLHRLTHPPRLGTRTAKWPCPAGHPVWIWQLRSNALFRCLAAATSAL